MGGMFSAGGLITGLDSNALINALLQLERQPVRRFEDRITRLENQRNAVRDLRTNLLTLRNRAQDFRLNDIFSSFKSVSSQTSTLTAQISAPNPVTGAFAVNVSQLATATIANSSAALGAAINPAANLNSSGITTPIDAGTFTINGVQFNVDPSTNSLNNILSAINGSAAGVTATYNAVTDRVTVENSTSGDASLVNFGATGDTSNLLSVLGLTQANQSGTGAGGATQVTSTRNLGAINSGAPINTVSFAGGAVSAGAFSINGVSISIDPSTDSVQDLIDLINSSDAGVAASYDSATDTLRFVSKTLGTPTIRFGAVGDTSNFIAVANLSAAVQTAGQNAEFTINGGPVQSRNTNTVSDAIGGVTLSLLATGTSSVTVSRDEEAITTKVREFVDAFNASINLIREQTGREGRLSGDGGIRSIEDYLRGNIFSQVVGVTGSYKSFVDIGLTSGGDFTSTTPSQLEFNEEAFLNAFRDDPNNVRRLFSNDDSTGIADLFFTFIDDATKATGFLNERARASGGIDQQIQGLRDQIDRLEDRILQKETRLRRQFTQLERLASGFQSQGASLSALSRGFF